MNVHKVRQQTFGLTEAVILFMVLTGYILHETVTNPVTPLLVVLWGMLIMTIVYVLKQSIEQVATFIDDVRHR